MFCDLGPHTTGIKNSKNPYAFKAIFVVKEDVIDKMHHCMQGFISGDLLFYAFMYTKNSLNIWQRTVCKNKSPAKFLVSPPPPPIQIVIISAPGLWNFYSFGKQNKQLTSLNSDSWKKTINSHGVKQMQNNFHHKYHDHNLFSTQKTPDERIIKKTVCFILK